MLITTKGQVTIPQALRERYGFLPHTHIDFVEEGGKLILRKKSRAVTALRGQGTEPVTTDAILGQTRGESSS